MRPIVSNIINAPTYQLAKWLISEFQKLPQFESLSVKNSLEFVEKIKDIKLNDNEIMISSDVSSLFPSIPIDVALVLLGEYFEAIDIEKDKKELYLEIAKLCMNQSFF